MLTEMPKKSIPGGKKTKSMGDSQWAVGSWGLAQWDKASGQCSNYHQRHGQIRKCMFCG